MAKNVTIAFQMLPQLPLASMAYKNAMYAFFFHKDYWKYRGSLNVITVMYWPLVIDLV